MNNKDAPYAFRMNKRGIPPSRLQHKCKPEDSDDEDDSTTDVDEMFEEVNDLFNADEAAMPTPLEGEEGEEQLMPLDKN